MTHPGVINGNLHRVLTITSMCDIAAEGFLPSRPRKYAEIVETSFSVDDVKQLWTLSTLQI